MLSVTKQAIIFVIQVLLSLADTLKVNRNLYYERWLNISGSQIDDLTSDPRFPNQPSEFGYYKDFKRQTYGTNFGGRYRAYLRAPETGNYTFYTFCDDSCQLYLSSDISPRNKRMIVNQPNNFKGTIPEDLTNCCTKDFPTWSPRYLEESKLYYIEALLKQGTGYDRLRVAMTTPTGAENPITGKSLRKNITKYDIPGTECQTEGDIHFPDYVNCKEFSDSQRIDLVLSKIDDLQSEVENAARPSYDFLLNTLKTAGKTTSDLLERLNSSSSESDIKISNRGFEVAMAIEKLGESIAWCLNNNSQKVVAKYSSTVMQASSGEQSVSFSHGSVDNTLNISLQNSSKTRTGFFSALYNNLDKAIKSNIDLVFSDNGTYEETPHILNSRILSGSVQQPDNQTFNGLVTFRLEHSQFYSTDKMKKVCAFWQFSNSSGNTTGHWSTEGCHMDQQLSDQESTVCVCNHLTHFAILMTVNDDHKVTTPGEPHVKALQMITYVGCGLSLVGEALTITTITCLKLTRAETSLIHINLVSALAVAQTVFLTGIEATANKVACKIVAVLLHYFNLVSFSWMLVEGVWLYVMIVRVFDTGHSRISKYAGCAWGIPLVFVIITLSASFDGYGTATSCWLSVQKGTIWSFVVPVLIIALANSIILGMVVKEIVRLSDPSSVDINKYQSVRSGVRSAIVLLPLLGITWVFGILTFNSNTLVFQYLFAIFSSLQGFFIFLFHCLLNSEVRRAFSRKKKIWTETHDLFQTHSLSPQKYNDLSKETLSIGQENRRPGSAPSQLFQTPVSTCTSGTSPVQQTKTEQALD